MAEFLLDHIDYCISSAAVLAYIIIFVLRAVKISMKKKNAQNKDDSLKPSSKYILSLVLAFVLIILPVFIHFKWFYTLLFCAAGVMAETVVFKERMEELEKIN